MPPPIHGAAMIGKWIHDSQAINEKFECHYINLSVSTNISEVGTISLKKIFTTFLLIYTIIKHILKIRPDLCYYTPTSDGWGIYKDTFITSIIKLLCKKTVLHFHNKGVKEYSLRKNVSFIYKILFNNVNVIQISKELYSDISKFVSIENVYFLPNAIPQSINGNQYDLIKKERHKETSKIRLLFLSNLLITKGVYVLLNACAELNNENIPFECHYIGNSGDVTINDFKSEVIKKGLNGKVFVHGPKYKNEKNFFFTNSDIFIFPTYHETFGLVLLEAMEFGLPCISTPEGGIPSLITSENGLLVKQKDSHELAEAIKILISNPEKRITMGENGRNTFLKKYTIKTFEMNFINIFNKILSI